MAMGIIIASVLLVIALFYLYKAQNYHGPTVSFFITIIIAVLFFSLIIAYIKFGSGIETVKDVFSFVKFYFSWLGNLMKGARSLTGSVINQDWGVNATAG